jgi:hypothetical protein
MQIIHYGIRLHFLINENGFCYLLVITMELLQGLEKIAVEGTDLTAKEISAVMKLTQKFSNTEGSS